jgi:hypothetical protein
LLYRRVAAVFLGIVLLAGVSGTALADNPHDATNPTGRPNQSCQDLGLTTPGHAAGSPGSPFNEPGSGGDPTNPGGVGGQHYSETSQYDVACFQQAQH